MANIQMNRGTKAEIDNTPITDGLISFDTDNNYIYLDNEDSRESYGGVKVIPNPEEEPTEVLRNIQVGEDVYKISGGHEIQDDSGDTLTQRDVMQFEGVYAYDDDTEGDEKTKISIVREFQSKSAIEALTGEEAKGFQYLDDDVYDAFTASDIGFDNSDTSFTGTDVQEVLEEVDSALDDLDNKIKFDNLTGTTNNNGSIVIPNNRKIIHALIKGGVSYTYRLGNAGGVTYIHIMDELGNSISSTNVDIDYYYLNI